MYVLNLNHVLARLAAMLPDPILRSDVRLFVYLNFGLFLALVIGLWMHQQADWVFDLLRQATPAFAESIGSYLGLAAMMKAAINPPAPLAESKKPPTSAFRPSTSTVNIGSKNMKG